MPRIPYRESDLVEPRQLVEAIRRRRGGTLLHLDRMLLHSPSLARGWNIYLGVVRNELELHPKLRELAMCVVAVMNDAEYEFHHHAPEFIRAGGTPAQADALRQLRNPDCDLGLFSPLERAAIQVAVEMTRDVQVADATFLALHSALGNDQLMVEFIGVVATYNMVSRFLVALQITPE